MVRLKSDDKAASVLVNVYQKIMNQKRVQEFRKNVDAIHAVNFALFDEIQAQEQRLKAWGQSSNGERSAQAGDALKTCISDAKEE